MLSWLKHDLNERKQHIAEVKYWQIENIEIVWSSDHSQDEPDKLREFSSNSFPAQFHLLDGDAYVVYAAHEPCTFAAGVSWIFNVLCGERNADTRGFTVQRALTRGHEISSAARATQSDDDATNERTTTGRNATLCLCCGWVYSISNEHPMSGWRIWDSVTCSIKIDVLYFNMPYMINDFNYWIVGCFSHSFFHSRSPFVIGGVDDNRGMLQAAAVCLPFIMNASAIILATTPGCKSHQCCANDPDRVLRRSGKCFTWSAGKARKNWISFLSN